MTTAPLPDPASTAWELLRASVVLQLDLPLPRVLLLRLVDAFDASTAMLTVAIDSLVATGFLRARDAATLLVPRATQERMLPHIQDHDDRLLREVEAAVFDLIEDALTGNDLETALTLVPQARAVAVVAHLRHSPVAYPLLGLLGLLLLYAGDRDAPLLLAMVSNRTDADVPPEQAGLHAHCLLATGMVQLAEQRLAAALQTLERAATWSHVNLVPRHPLHELVRLTLAAARLAWSTAHRLLPPP